MSELRTVAYTQRCRRLRALHRRAAPPCTLQHGTAVTSVARIAPQARFPNVIQPSSVRRRNVLLVVLGGIAVFAIGFGLRALVDDDKPAPAPIVTITPDAT